MSKTEENVKKNFLWDFFFSKDDDKNNKSKITILQKVPLFEDLSKRELRRMDDIIHDRVYEDGEYIFETGVPGAAVFVIRKGSVAIVGNDDKGNEIELAKIQDGAFFGELALLDDSPRSASAKAIGKVETYAIFRTELNKMLELESVIGCKILKKLSFIIGQRLKKTNEQLFGKN